MKNKKYSDVNVILDFSIFYLPLVIISLYLITSYTKIQVHLLLTAENNGFLDILFKNLTLLGNAFFIVSVGVLFLLYRVRMGGYILLTQLFNVTITRILKVYFNADRPITYFAKYLPDVHLHQVKGVVLSAYDSFPSAHTSAVFALMLSIAFILKQRIITFICCLLAILTGYSRIYLSQHFISDVLFGSIIGIFSAVTGYFIYCYILNSNKIKIKP